MGLQPNHSQKTFAQHSGVLHPLVVARSMQSVNGLMDIRPDPGTNTKFYKTARLLKPRVLLHTGQALGKLVEKVDAFHPPRMQTLFHATTALNLSGENSNHVLTLDRR